MATIHVTLNGDARALPEALTIAALLERLAIDPRVVAVERNRRVIKRAAFGGTPVRDGDEIEIVNFVGGG